MNEREISYIISYDGQTGGKQHGQPLPRHLSLRHLHIHAGRSSQLTLLGQACETVESLYLSPALVERLAGSPSGQNDAHSRLSCGAGMQELEHQAPCRCEAVCRGG